MNIVAEQIGSPRRVIEVRPESEPVVFPNTEPMHEPTVAPAEPEKVPA